MGVPQVVATATAWSDIAWHHFREVTKKVCGCWWYQNFVYICRASEAVVSARGLRYVAQVGIFALGENQSGEALVSSLFFCLHESVRESVRCKWNPLCKSLIYRGAFNVIVPPSRIELLSKI